MECAQKSNKSLSRQGGVGLSGPLALSHLESGHAIPFSPQDFHSPCDFFHCCHNTRTPWAGVLIGIYSLF